eukprot:9471625-Pyramimonas_sp.AAC.1
MKLVADVTKDDDLLPALLLLTINKDRRYKARLVARGNFQRVSNAFTHATVAGAEEWLSLL